MNYDELGITIKPSNNYLIYGISGDILCNKDINLCFSQKENIMNDFKSNYGDEIVIRDWEGNHDMDPTGKSKVYSSSIFLKEDGVNIEVKVYDMAIEGYSDTTSIEIRNEEYENFLTNKAYN